MKLAWERTCVWLENGDDAAHAAPAQVEEVADACAGLRDLTVRGDDARLKVDAAYVARR